MLTSLPSVHNKNCEAHFLWIHYHYMHAKSWLRRLHSTSSTVLPIPALLLWRVVFLGFYFERIKNLSYYYVLLLLGIIIFIMLATAEATGSEPVHSLLNGWKTNHNIHNMLWVRDSANVVKRWIWRFFFFFSSVSNG